MKLAEDELINTQKTPQGLLRIDAGNAGCFASTGALLNNFSKNILK